MYTAPVNKKPVQKARHLHEIPEKKKVWPCIGDVKKDGVYAYALISDEEVHIYSRTGMEYLSLNHLKPQLFRICRPYAHDYVIIFEVYSDDYPVNTISGNCRSKSRQHPELIAIAHDWIPYEDFIQAKCMIAYKHRKSDLQACIHIAKPKDVYFSETFPITSEEHAQEIFEKVTSKGEEGIIGRNPNGIWVGGHKKNADYWKMKIELSYDLLVYGVNEGSGKYKGTTGTVSYYFRKFGKPDGELCLIKASGMTDAQRKDWWENSPRGAIHKVDAMTFTINGLLREPRFKEVREDKLEADF